MDNSSLAPPLSQNLWLIESLLHPVGVHLLAGPSGSGKTTLLLQWLMAVKHGEQVLGRTTHDLLVGWICGDRSTDALRATAARVGSESLPPMMSLINLGKLVDLEAALEQLPAVDFVIVDPLMAFLRNDSNAYHVVMKFLIELQSLCRSRGIGIIGTVHTAKARERDIIFNPREKILGSVAWAGYSDTIIHVDSTDPAQVTNADRRLVVLPRNSAPEEHFFTLDDRGRFVSVADVVFAANLPAKIASFPVGFRFQTHDVLSWPEAQGISRRTVESRLAAAVDSGLIRRVDRGLYERAR